ncbi:unnamed protein product [Caenorhabditis auriculariae]|uniref:Protein Wnt n=1 Tax=Caenorhabditis auriculariae TaxID=2777116 RepID=A0A8S1HND1_9PELO|nr:unnamed protein product [Caenorhabditis auriculariae]
MLRQLLLLLLLGFLPTTASGWWLLSKADETRLARHASACNAVPGLSQKQRELCTRHPNLIKYLVSGLRLALNECQESFRHNVWNCTLALPGVGTSPLKVASRESAYVYAIASAGVSHSLARACSKGLIDECGCGGTPRGGTKEFTWAGCSDNVRFGNSFGRKFMDVTEKQHADARALMNLHNNRVGRRLLASSLSKECKCHGVSGSCVTKTCWKIVPKFNDFAKRLNEKYEIAHQVTVTGPSAQLILRPEPTPGGRTERYLKHRETNEMSDLNTVKNDLIFFDASPNYCAIDVKDRECGSECGNICCGRGWRTIREVVDEPCHCQFVWCCEVKCKTCKRVVERNYCI